MTELPPLAGRCFIQINSCASDSVFAIVLGVFLRIKFSLDQTKRGSAFSRYGQFETSPETIEQELRPNCDRQTDLRRISLHAFSVN